MRLLKAELNACHKVDIQPSEMIKYDKEIQTNSSVLINHKERSCDVAYVGGDETSTNEDEHESDDGKTKTRFKKTR